MVATVLLAFNFWFLDHSERALERIVERQSNGNIQLVVEEFKFNWITNKIELNNAVLRSKDTTAATQYLFKSNQIAIKATGFLPLLFNRILIDSIHIYSPEVVVTRLRENPQSVNQPKVKNADENGNFSVAEEIGRITNTINNVIRELKINRFVLDDGSFSLVNKVRPEEVPFLVDNIDIRLYNLQVDSASIAKTQEQQSLQFTDEIAIQTSNQDMVFPGGKHFLSFKNFRVTLQDQRVEFDSCTYRSIGEDTAGTSANVFFDKLKLTGIDFDAFYSSELVKADSVYCLNPDVFLDIHTSTNKDKPENQGPPNVDSIVKSLFGDLQLHKLVVQNADININTHKEGNVNKFVSKNNQIEITDFVIDRKAANPVQFGSFLLSLYNYKTTLNDGRFAFAFDSLKFLDKALNLYNFSFQENAGCVVQKDLKMSKFELRDLSWEALLYENRFQANNAKFINPNIDIVAGNNNSGQSRNIFETLNSIDESMSLSNLEIVNGNILVRLKKGGRLQLYNTDLSLLPNNLTASKQVKNLKQSVANLYTKEAVFIKNSTNVSIQNLRLVNDNDGLTASALLLKDKGVNARLNDVAIHTILLDDNDDEIELNNISWNRGNVTVNRTGNNQQQTNTNNQSQSTPIAINNIRGRNTQLAINIDEQDINGYFEILSVDKVALVSGGKPAIYGLQFQGRDFSMRSPVQLLSIERLHITDNNNSVINDITFRKVDAKDSIVGIIPQITIIPDISQIINGNVHVNSLVIEEPDVYAKLGKKDSAVSTNTKKSPSISVGSLLLKRPNVQLEFEGKGEMPSLISWQGNKYESFVQLNNFTSNENVPASADLLKIFLTYFEFMNNKGKKFATNDNKLNLEFENVVFEKDENKAMHWSTNANILSLDKLKFDSLGKNNITVTLDNGDVRNIALNSRHPKVGDILKNSSNLLMTGTSGSLTTVNNYLNWNNLQFNNGYFKIDSFGMRPVQPLEEYKIKKAFNQDYLTFTTGLITGGPFDMEKYIDDSILVIGGVEVNDVNLRTVKDRTQEDTATKTKPLFAEMFKNISSKVDIDSVTAKNMYVEYWEVTDKTDTLAIIPVSNLNATFYNIKNHNLENTDSLYIVASADVLNELKTHLRINQSYTDSLYGYNMNLYTGPVDLKVFNKLLVPMIGFDVAQGQLDSLRMFAIPNDDYSKGEMKMYYTGLKMRMLDKKNLPNQKFYHKIASWLANALIIRNNNNGKPSPIFDIRMKEKSPINQIIKTALSGLKSSVGLPGTKRKERKYFRNKEKEKSYN